jgi:hypothetical protein
MTPKLLTCVFETTSSEDAFMNRSRDLRFTCKHSTIEVKDLGILYITEALGLHPWATALEAMTFKLGEAHWGATFPP